MTGNAISCLLPGARGKRVAERHRISVEGIVQGVGFRPFVYRLATRMGLKGWVSNTSDGVIIEVEGEPGELTIFERHMRMEIPPLARIDDLTREIVPEAGYREFTIRHSLAGADPRVLVSPDTATCTDCRMELLDPSDRRYRYPFINCVNCGPRYTIIRKVPYDRPNTSMDSFTMCPECQAEYDDPSNRRFHAQPNACPDCGPVLTLQDSFWKPMDGDPLYEAVRLIKEDKIVAIKGLGGYHLAVNPYSSRAVTRLRERKGREEKPFALMVRDLAAAGKLCPVDEYARDILESTESPVTLLPRLEDPELPVVHEVAPRSSYFGIILPYTPLHILVMEECEVLVMTSANLSEEPLCAENEEARERLDGIADAFLTHDREIVLRCDDSIVRLDTSKPEGGGVVLRRARGFVPSPVMLPLSGKPVLALGPELKGTVCLTRDDRAFIGQHLGDLKNLETLDFLKEVTSHLMDILEVEPSVIVRDLHPDYLTSSITQSGEEVPWRRDLPVFAVQHHHAHILSCQAEYSMTGPCIGIALDGTGYGIDGTVWGGEILGVDGTDMRRLGHLKPIWMPGGDKAIEEPWRMAVSCMVEIMGKDEALFLSSRLFPEVPEDDLAVISDLCAGKTHGILTSSTGRLFDALSAILGVCSRSHYEGQAAIELEMMTREGVTDMLPYTIREGPEGDLMMDMMPAFSAIVEMVAAGKPADLISGMFHATLAGILTEAVSIAARKDPDTDGTVFMGGGVFQNRILCDLIRFKMEKHFLRPQFHKAVPTNDGGISLGQAVYGLLKQREDRDW
jgi:hydrogenase maturation protein HypF